MKEVYSNRNAKDLLDGSSSAKMPDTSGIGIRDADDVLLPDGELKSREDKRLQLQFSQLFAKLRPDFLPFEMTLGRRNFEDPRLWVYDSELDTAILNFKPGDFRVEASVSRQDAVDLDLAGHVVKKYTNNYMVSGEYRPSSRH